MGQQQFSANSRHYIIEFQGADNLDNTVTIEAAMRDAAKAAGATILKSMLHHFGENDGVTGIVLLAESHISIHTWPEYEYAAIDIFMCGETRPDLGLDVLRSFFSPKEETIQVIQRAPITMTGNPEIKHKKIA